MLKPLISRVKHYFRSTRLPLALLNVQNISRESARCMSVYVYLASSTRPAHSDRLRELSAFFTNHVQKLRQRAPQIPIFLEESMAIRHGQFRHVPYVIFKLVVPESAIMGRTQSLMIKTEAISAETIHGCFLGWETPEMYLKNPLYAEKRAEKRASKHVPA